MRAAAFVLATSFSLLSTANASEVILSNRAQSLPLDRTTVFGEAVSTVTKDFGFTMRGDSFRLDEVVLQMTFFGGNPQPVLEIQADAGGVPGATLFTLAPPANLVGEGDFTFEASSEFLLEANTTYWLSLRSDPLDGDRFNWQGSSQATLPAGDHADTVDFLFNASFSSSSNFLEIRGTAVIGVNFCDATPNSTGVAGTIAATGSRVAAANDLTLTASSLPDGAFGFFIASQTQGFVMNPGTSAGNLCLGGEIGRYVAPGQVLNTGQTGSISLSLDLTNTPQPTGAVSILAGETWNFQAWHRDALPSGPTSNYTVGLQIDFV